MDPKEVDSFSIAGAIAVSVRSWVPEANVDWEGILFEKFICEWPVVPLVVPLLTVAVIEDMPVRVHIRANTVVSVSGQPSGKHSVLNKQFGLAFVHRDWMQKQGIITTHAPC